MTQRRIVLGVCGGIAAYKAADVLRRLIVAGHDVQVVPTDEALRFVGSATWEGLSGNPVATDVWTAVPDVPHVRLGKDADLVIVAPATADLLSRAAVGRANDLLTATLLTARCPVLFAPAMHTEMWEHSATVDNVALLRQRGSIVLDPAVGRLTGKDIGPGRLPEPEHLVELAELLLVQPTALPRDLAGRTVIVTAGGTREFVDPARFLGNRSSGRQGFALALVAAARGADVTLVAANTTLIEPPGVRCIPITSAAEMRDAVISEAPAADAVVMAAAVADFRPANYTDTKIKRTATAPKPLELSQNPDVLAELVGARQIGQVLVGFAAETGDEHADVLEYGRRKLAHKGCDLMVVNQVGNGRGFEVAENSAVILGADGAEWKVPLGPKSALAAVVWDAVVNQWQKLPPQ